MFRPAWLFGALFLSGTALAADALSAAQSATVIGPLNPMLTEGSQEL